jgi:PAS domain S-box-containing protein
MPVNSKNDIHIDHFVNSFGVKQVIEMFDLMNDTLFWVKDIDGRFVYANQYFLEHLGVSSLGNAIGHNDFDFSAPHIAKQFTVDDQKVLQGEAVINRLEMNNLKNGKVSWFTTSKKPLFNELGEVIGTYGISRHLDKTSEVLDGFDAVKVPVEYIKKNYMNDICIDKLADVSHLSISALERRFKKHLRKTPKQFVNEIRLENARRLLVESKMAISDVANDSGFTDHSYFSKQFKKLFGQLPSEFRSQQFTIKSQPTSNETLT